MTRSRIALLLALSAEACGPPLTPTASPSPAAWQALRPSLSSDYQRLAEQLEQFRQAHGLPLEFLADSTLDSLSFDIHDGPCGPQATVFVMRLPVEPRSYSGDLVIEIDSSGQELRRWITPLYSLPGLLAGDELLVPFFPADDTRRVLLAIRMDGAYRVVSAPESGPDAPYEDCPSLEAFKGSGYLVCASIPDARSTRVHRLAFQLPCT